jgi:hypothetical protein
MGKIKVKKSKRDVGQRVNSRVYVGRSKGKGGFEACVVVGKTSYKRTERAGARVNGSCGKGRSPKLAIAAALRAAAKTIAQRSSAFHGLK